MLEAKGSRECTRWMLDGLSIGEQLMLADAQKELVSHRLAAKALLLMLLCYPGSQTATEGRRLSVSGAGQALAVAGARGRVEQRQVETSSNEASSVVLREQTGPRCWPCARLAAHATGERVIRGVLKVRTAGGGSSKKRYGEARRDEGRRRRGSRWAVVVVWNAPASARARLERRLQVTPRLLSHSRTLTTRTLPVCNSPPTTNHLHCDSGPPTSTTSDLATATSLRPAASFLRRPPDGTASIGAQQRVLPRQVKRVAVALQASRSRNYSGMRPSFHWPARSKAAAPANKLCQDRQGPPRAPASGAAEPHG